VTPMPKAPAPWARVWIEVPASPLAPLAAGCRRWVLRLPASTIVVVSSVDALPDPHWHVSISLVTADGAVRPSDAHVEPALIVFGMEGATEDNRDGAMSSVRHFWQPAGEAAP
jgi:hypothetical protein